MLKVITFFNVKGGVGKTTLTVNTAAKLAHVHPGKSKVLILDLDAQAGATNYIFGAEQQEHYEKEEKTLYNLLLEMFSGSQPNIDDYAIKAFNWSGKLYVVPGSYSILEAEKAALTSTGLWLLKLREIVHRAVDFGYNYIFIDPPATFGVLTKMALAASQYFVIPVIPDQLGLGAFKLLDKGFRTFIVDLRTVLSIEELPVCGGVVFNRLKSKTHYIIADKIAEEARRHKLYGRYPIPVYKTRLDDTVDYTKCLERHEPIFTCKGISKKTKEQFERYFKEFYAYVVEDGARKVKK